MEAVGGATSSLLPKLGALLQDEYKLQDKVKRDIESLQHELVFMNATLRMVAKMPSDEHDEHIRIWAVIIKDVTYDMEDVVNTFVARVQVAPHLGGLIRKAFNMLCLGRTHHQIASMVEEIKSLIKEVADLRDRYRFDNILNRTSSSDYPRQRHHRSESYHPSAIGFEPAEIAHLPVGINYEYPVGVEADMEVLRNWITSGDNHGGMLCILGPSGMGKTTIAMALYRDYGDQFQRRVMVNVSQDSTDPETALVDILSQVKPRELQSHDGDILKIKEELRECLQGRRFLVLLDDVWSAELLDHIRKSLPHTDPGSRIIVTTRFDAVTRAFEREKGDCVHEVGLLDYEKAGQLFMEVVGRDQENIPPTLWEVCGGLPLAIVTMAGMAACNPYKSREAWSRLCDSLQSSPGTSHPTDQFRILSTCYIDMPVEIRTCSFYLTIFPRGQKISRKRLIRRWISDGVIIEKDASKEEVAEANLNNLIRRKILRAVEHSSNGKVKSYQVHDVVLEHIVSKASENNFVTTIGGSVMSIPSRKIRRLSVQCSFLKYEEELQMMNLSHVRDLTMFGSMKHLPSSSFKFRVVQVLDLEGCKDFKQHHTKKICRMLLLKYLSLRGTDIKKLTKKIGCLRYLETLDIRETNVIELPKTICLLKRVINIFGGNKRTRMALKLPEEMWRKKAMKALRILSGIEISEETSGVADLHYLTELRKLAIYKLNISKEGPLFDQLSSSIKHLNRNYHLRTLVIHEESSEFFKSLEDLSLCPKFLNALELSGKLVKLPKCIAEMDALTQLTLSVTALRSDNLELLSKIRSLFSLTFSLNAAKQDEETTAIIEDNRAGSDGVISFPVDGFENLKLLHFFAPYVPQLSFPDGAMPTLKRLELRFSNFEGLVGIKGLKNLQEVHIKVYDEASEATESIIKEMAIAAREDHEGPRIILH